MAKILFALLKLLDSTLLSIFAFRFLNPMQEKRNLPHSPSPPPSRTDRRPNKRFPVEWCAELFSYRCRRLNRKMTKAVIPSSSQTPHKIRQCHRLTMAANPTPKTATGTSISISPRNWPVPPLSPSSLVPQKGTAPLFTSCSTPLWRTGKHTKSNGSRMGFSGDS